MLVNYSVPVQPSFWSFLVGMLLQTLQNFPVVVLVNLLIGKTKFLMINAVQLGRITNMFLMFGLTCLTFSGYGEDVLFK
jgi:hypothetical protein